MICPTPELDIPDIFQDTADRRRRDTYNHHSHSNSRTRRQVASAEEPDSINNDTLTFYLGFILDGVESYKNMSIVNPHIGVIRVYRNPEIEMFTDEGHVKPYMIYWPVNDNHIIIQVSYPIIIYFFDRIL